MHSRLQNHFYPASSTEKRRVVWVESKSRKSNGVVKDDIVAAELIIAT
jgi:hypothetical protein